MIAPIQGLPPVEGGQQVEKKSTDVGNSFMSALKDAREMNDDATQKAEAFANHDPKVGIHEVVIAAEKANVAVRYAVTLKNKALEAYRELMNTQV